MPSSGTPSGPRPSPSGTAGRRPCPALLRVAACILTLCTFSSEPGISAGALPAEDGRGKAAKPHVGSAMAVLATLAQAQVLPPERSPEANQIIKSVIQFQSAFTKSRDKAIDEFASQALAAKYGDQAEPLLTEFHQAGWTAPVLESLAEAEERATAAQVQALADGFSAYNLSTADFHRFMGLVRAARQTLESRGLTFQQVYASHRRTMPGAEREPRGEAFDYRL